MESAPKDRPVLVRIYMPKIGIETFTTAEFSHEMGDEWHLCESGAYAEDTRVEPTHWNEIPKFEAKE